MSPSETKLLVRLAVFAAGGQHVRLLKLAQSKSFRNVPNVKIIETLLEVHLFAGYPVAIESFAVVGSALQLSNGEKTKSIPVAERRRRGEATCKKVYGKRYSALVTAMERLNLELADWILEDGYGKVLSRPGLSLRERELIAIAILAALGWKRQLHSHIIGSLNAGAKPYQLRSVLRVVTQVVTKRRASLFRAQLLRVESSMSKKNT